LHQSSLKILARCRAAMAPFLCLGLAACSPAADTPPELAAPSPPEPGGCAADGTFRARLYGEIAADITWRGSQYECRGMPRPEGRGARLYFAGHDDAGDQRLAFILALPAFDRDAASRELDSTLTVIEEGTGRFFSTATDSGCVTDLSAIDPAAEDAGALTIHGSVFCVSPLAEVNGESSVSIAELRFTGMLEWDER
jgi:hypothetical protein